MPRHFFVRIAFVNSHTLKAIERRRTVIAMAPQKKKTWSYWSIKEASEAWGISPRRVNKLCNTGRIAGAIKKSGVWFIPEGSPKPDDLRLLPKKHDDDDDD